MKYLLITVLGILSFGSHAQSNWYQVDVGTDKDLYGISFGSASTGYIVGEDGLLLKTTDGGSTWNEVTYSGLSFGFGGAFRDVEFVNPWIGYVTTGSGGFAYKTIDGGLNWLAMDGDATICFSEAVFMFAEDNGLHGGSGCFIGEQMDVISSGSATAANIEFSGFSTAEQIVDIDFLDLNLGLAASTSGRIYRTTDGGANWDSLTVYSGPDIYPLTSVQFLNADTAYAGYIGDGSGFGMFISEDGGLSWDMETEAATFAYPDYTCLTKDESETIYCGSSNGWGFSELIFEKKAGQAWVYATVDKAIFDMDAYSDSIAWAIGDSGWVLVNVPPAMLNSHEWEMSDELTIYPNPANDLITIQVEELDSPKDFEIYIINELGQLVFRGRNENTISVEDFEKGLYYVRMEKHEKSYTSKLVIN